MHQSSGTKGRGSLITLLSKSTIDSTIDAIGHLIKEFIANDVRKVGMFSVQLDTTQDITTQDQCSVILRYVTDTVHERLVALVRCQASTGQYFVNLLSEVLEHLGLYKALCIGNSTDGVVQYAGPIQRIFLTYDLPVSHSRACVVICTCTQSCAC